MWEKWLEQVRDLPVDSEHWGGATAFIGDLTRLVAENKARAEKQQSLHAIVDDLATQHGDLLSFFEIDCDALFENVQACDDGLDQLAWLEQQFSEYAELCDQTPTTISEKRDLQQKKNPVENQISAFWQKLKGHPTQTGMVLGECSAEENESNSTDELVHSHVSTREDEVSESDPNPSSEEPTNLDTDLSASDDKASDSGSELSVEATSEDVRIADALADSQDMPKAKDAGDSLADTASNQDDVPSQDVISSEPATKSTSKTSKAASKKSSKARERKKRLKKAKQLKQRTNTISRKRTESRAPVKPALELAEELAEEAESNQDVELDVAPIEAVSSEAEINSDSKSEKSDKTDRTIEDRGDVVPDQGNETAAEAEAELQGEQIDEPSPGVVQQSPVMSESSELPSSDPGDLPEDLKTFEKFEGAFFVLDNEPPEPTPWKQDLSCFADQIHRSLQDQLKNDELARAIVSAAALKRIASHVGSEPASLARCVDADDILATHEVLANPSNLSAGTRSGRTQRISESIAGKSDAYDIRLALSLDAIRHNHGFDYETASERAEFDFAALRDLVKDSLAINSRGWTALGMLDQKKRGDNSASQEDLESKSRKLLVEIREKRISIGQETRKKLKLTHCQRAWALFLQKSRKDFEAIESEKTRIVSEAIETIVNSIRETFLDAMESGEVKFSERRKAENAFDVMCDPIIRLIETTKQQEQRKEKKRVPVANVPISELHTVLEADLGKMDSVERLCCRVWRSVFNQDDPIVGSSSLTNSDYVNALLLLGIIPEEARSDTAAWAIDANTTDDDLYAAAWMLSAHAAQESKANDRAVRRAARSAKRPDMLDLFGASDADDKRFVKDSRRIALRDLNQRLDGLMLANRRLNDLALPIAMQLDSTTVEAKTRCDALWTRFSEDTHLRGALYEARNVGVWIDQLTRFLQSHIDHKCQQLKDLIAREDEPKRTLLANALEEKRYADCLFVLQEDSPERNDHNYSSRQTIYRDEAAARYENPSAYLASLDTSDGPLKDLRLEWAINHSVDRKYDRPLKTSFAKWMRFVLEKADKSGGPVGQNEHKGISVPTEQILDWLNEQREPTFVPQLRKKFAKLIICIAKTSTTSNKLPQSIETVARELCRFESNLCIFLTPGLSQNARSNVLNSLNPGKGAIAIVDDLDLCRLLEAGGGNSDVCRMLGLLEIAFEQQSPERFSPFERHDGKQSFPEMFVGRRDEVDRIINGYDYNRLFSGRKLGKTALLKYVQENGHGIKLPSGNDLRVVFVSGISNASPDQFVSSVIDAIEEQVGLQFESNQDSAIDRLTQTCKEFCQRRPTENLLILFDEADLFVEEQIADYDRVREESLTFAIRNKIENETDGRIPRVRFMFSGYRVTNQNAGVWAGAWGACLQLDALEPANAEILVRGPLERMGIRVGHLGSRIAWQCGYQPMIILTMCRKILKGMQSPAALTDSDVSRAFESKELRDEIESVVASNFQGNTKGEITFLIALILFSGCDTDADSNISGVAHDGSIVDLPQAIEGWLNDQKLPQTWLQSGDEGTIKNELAAQVRDFMDRKLIVMKRNSEGSKLYTLRFPHFINAVIRPIASDPRDAIRSKIERYEKSSVNVRRSETRPGTRLQETLRECWRHDKPTEELPLSAVVVGSQWLMPFQLERLYEPDTYPATEVSSPVSRDDSDLLKPRVFIANATAEDLRTVLLAREALDSEISFPPVLTGGAALLREAYKVEAEGFLIDVRGLRRLDRRVVEWWVSRFHAIELSTQDMDRVLKATGGIPLLVSWLEEVAIARDYEGQTLSSVEVNKWIRGLDQQCLDFATKLKQEGLSSREIDLLKMCCVIPGDEELKKQPLGTIFSEWWPEYESELPNAGKFESSTDLSSIKMLVELGLLNTLANATDGELPGRDDPLRKLFAS